MSLRHCLMRGCPEYTSASYCPLHEKQRRQDYKGDWPKIRNQQLQRRRKCERCGRRATDVDHRVPRRDGGTNAPANLLSLCHSCHSGKTASGG